MPTPNWREESVAVAGIDVHFYRGGEGPPLVLLHGGSGDPGWLQHHQALAEPFSVYAPSHPGFGHTPGLAWIATIADMALFYLWFLDALGLERVHLVGHDIGGWLAANIATACPHVVDRLVLVDAMGLKPQHSEILDIFLITLAEVRARSFFDAQQVPEWQADKKFKSTFAALLRRQLESALPSAPRRVHGASCTPSTEWQPRQHAIFVER